MPHELHESFRVEVLLGEVIDVGDTAHGRRRVIPITGGMATGELEGTILPAGADYQLIRADGVTELEAHYVLQTADGPVYVDNRGYRSASAEDVERLTRGDAVDPSRVYFRTTPRFETAVPSLAWVERTIFVGVAERHPDSVVVTFYRSE